MSVTPGTPWTTLAEQVRGFTLELLNATPADWLTFAPAGTSNHILWHAGHALWLQDLFCIEPLTGRSELPQGWAASFGGRCRPLSETRDWPDAVLLRRLLAAQLDRMLVLLPQVTGEQLADPRRRSTTGWTLHDGLLHGLHDEARHQGEMYLLFKLCRAGYAGESKKNVPDARSVRDAAGNA